MDVPTVTLFVKDASGKSGADRWSANRRVLRGAGQQACETQGAFGLRMQRLGPVVREEEEGLIKRAGVAGVGGEMRQVVEVLFRLVWSYASSSLRAGERGGEGGRQI